MALSTGAKLRMAHWDGDTFSTSLVPEGRFQAIAADLGPNPLGLAQFRVDGDGQWNGITLTMAEDGQTVEFVRQLPPAP